MTFDDFVMDEHERAWARSEHVTKDESKELAIDAILEGYRDERDARDDLEGMREAGNIRFTLIGYEVNAAILARAIEERWG